MNKIRIYLRLMAYLRRYSLRFSIAVFCTIIVGGLSAVPALLVKYVVDDLLIGRNVRIVQMLSLTVVAVYLLKSVATYLQNYFMYWVGHRVVMDIRNALHQHLVSLPLRFFDHKTTGELMAKVTYDIALMQKAASSAVRDLGRHFFTFIALLSVATYQFPKMVLLFLVVIAPIGFLVAKLGEKIRRITRKTQDKMGDISSLMKETYAGIRVVKAFGAERHEKERFEKANRSFFRTIMGAMRTRALAPPLVEAIGGILAGGVLWYGSALVIRGEVSPGQLSSFLVAVGMIYSPLKSLTRVYHTLMEGVAGCQSVFELMDNHGLESMNPGGRKMEPLTHSIQFSGVSFSYDDTAVLQDINLIIPAGSIFALVGMSGAGKTTFLDLIPYFYTPAMGRITFDGVDIREIDLSSLRRQIAVVGQHVVLFNDTVARNIAYGAGEPIDPEAVAAAAKAANAHEFICELPNGYETRIGENGFRLSGGERQRIAIARAIFRDPSILLLDEATSSLDTESELLIQEALDRLMKGRTTIVVAHRLSTVKKADKINVLDGGQIVEQGTHSELMAHGGLYHRLYVLQFADDDEISEGLAREDIESEGYIGKRDRLAPGDTNLDR